MINEPNTIEVLNVNAKTKSIKLIATKKKLAIFSLMVF